MTKEILLPAAVLVLWSLFMLFWMLVTRFGAFKAGGVDLSKAKPGGRGQDLDGVLPDHVQWKAHNFVHLMEQPTLFYAIVGILAIGGISTTLSVWLAWGYTILRVLHSIWQATVNIIMPVRVMLYGLSTLCLLGLSIQAVIALLTS